MMELLSCVLLLIAVIQISSGNPLNDPQISDKPEFCHEYDCPDYKLLKKVEGEYELREYPSAYWVSTRVVGKDMKTAGSAAFGTLFDYIQGENVDGVKIAMTAPVINHVTANDKTGCDNNFVYSFYVPAKYQESGPPAPTAQNVAVDRILTHRVYVREFSGNYYKAKDWIKQSKDFKAILTKDGLIDEVDQTFFYTAGYDSPFHLFNRHNEIWYYVTSGAIHTDSVAISNHISAELPMPGVFPPESVFPEENDVSKPKPPKFCHKLDCPKYTVDAEKSTEKYELRRYESAQWVSTEIDGLDMSKASSVAFYRLFDYIQGENEDGVKIDMTVPVINHVLPGAGPVCENTFTYSFFVPFKYQETGPPAPTATNVYLDVIEEHSVYVRSFPGHPKTDAEWVDQAVALVNDLTQDGVIDDVDQSFFYTAGYDNPLQVFKRHNEIWFFVKDAGDQSNDNKLRFVN